MAMDAYPPEELKLNEQIKLEHSYAREFDNPNLSIVMKDEDPLKIYPEDLDIKKETEEEETIVIKSEPGVPEDPCSSTNDAQAQNEVDDHGESSLMEVASSEPCESAERIFFLTCQEPVTCESGLASSQPVVPKHVFQELQRMYEKAMMDMKSLTKKLASEKQKKGSQSTRNTSSVRMLRNEIKKLKEQLKTTRNKEHEVRHALETRVREENDIKKSNNVLKSQLDDLMKINNERTACIADLRTQVGLKEEIIKNLRMSLKEHSKALTQVKRDSIENVKKFKETCSAKDAKHRDTELKYAVMAQKLAGATTKFLAQQKEFEKLKLDMDIMDKSIIDSVKTRQSLKDQVMRIEKDLQEVKENPKLTLKLNETQAALSRANLRLEETQKLLQAEKTSVATLVKEKVQLLRDHHSKQKETELQRTLLQNTVVTLKNTVDHKSERFRLAIEECRKLREEVERKREEVSSLKVKIKEKDEQFRNKQCEYCGF